MNEKRIQQVLEIEKQAQQIFVAAVSEAEKLPKQAEQDAQALIEKTRREAEQEVTRLLNQAQVDEECARIIGQVTERNQRMEILAKGNFDRAVSYVLARVIGQE